MKSQSTPPAAPVDRFEKLDLVTERLRVIDREIQSLKDAEPALRSEVERLTNRLSGLAPAFFVVAPPAGTLDDASESALRELTIARGRLEILPGAAHEAGKRRASVAKEVGTLVDDAWRDLRADIRDRASTEEKELNKFFGSRCGGDPGRTKAALTAAVAASETTRWLNDFTRATLPAEPLDRARVIKRCRAAWDARQTLSSAFRP